MRKLFVVLMTAAVLLAFTLPAMAQAQWSFYGSVRMLTQWQSTSQEVPNVMSGFGAQWAAANAWTAGVNGAQSDGQLVWSEQANSRIGAIVKSGDITGRFEYGGSTGDYYTNVVGQSADPENIRLLYAQWAFSKDGFFEIGRDYTPYMYIISGLCGPGVGGGSECDAIGMGAIYSGRRSQLKLGYLGFQVALVEPRAGTSPKALNVGPNGIVDTPTNPPYDPAVSLGYNTIPGGGTIPGDYHTQVSLPKLEASYGGNYAGFGYWAGGYYNQYTLEYAFPTGGKNDLDIKSYGLAIGGKYAAGPFNFALSLQWERNANNGNGYLVLVPNFYAWNPNTQVGSDADYYGGVGVVGFRLSDMISFEGGWIWQYATVADQVLAGTPTVSETSNTWYVQAVISPVKNFYIVPEIGQIVYGDLNVNNYPNRNLGNIFWGGIKWQIDF
jgi:hypothetical protein